jgi:hypothetical protein
MVRRSRKNMKGGDKIDDIVFRLDSIKEEIRGLKGLGSTTRLEESIMGLSPVMSEVMPQQIVPEVMSQQVMPPVMSQQVMPGATMVKPWVDDRNMKFRDGTGGRVTLGFGRLISLLDNNINRGNVNKDWASIKRDLIAANSVGEVQNVIDRYQISFSSNYVAGTRRNKRGGKRRTRRRH